MITVDAHQHYWDIDRFEYGWAASGRAALEHTFVPDDLEPQLATAGVQRTIAVQVLPSAEETAWLLALADRHSSIAGVVGWVDMTTEPDAIARAVEDLRRHHPRFVGLRHLVHDEQRDDWILQESVLRGLAVLEEHDVPFDLLLKERHLRFLPTQSARLPNLRMVIDHLAQPRIRDGAVEPWRRELTRAATNPRIWCKLSGLVTEARPSWTSSDLAPYIESAIDAFGTDRLMFGSDWPICTLAASYAQVIGGLREVLGDVRSPIAAEIFGGSAAAFYHLALETTA